MSAEVKRLQQLLGASCSTRAAPGVLLTPMAESVLGSARRLLAINDHMLNVTGVAPAEP